MTGRVALLVCAVLVAAAAPAAAADDVWGAIRVPGGVAGLRSVANLGVGPRARTSVLIDLVRVLYARSAHSSPEFHERIIAYLERVVALEVRLAEWPQGLALASATGTDRRERDRFEAILKLLTLRLRVVKDRPIVEAERDDDAVRVQGELRAAGLDVTAAVEELNKGQRIQLKLDSDEVPLPAPSLWHGVVFRKDQDPFVQFVTVPNTLWMYYGLMDLDRETLTWLARNPELFRRLYEERAAEFAAFAGGVHIREGKLALPGGTPAAPIWEQLAGARSSDIAKFLMNLFERNEGRLAYFYSTVASLDPARQAFLIGAAPRDAAGAKNRLKYVQNVRDWFAAACPIWKVQLQPFFRPSTDPAFVVSTVSLDRAGAVGPDWWPSVFRRVAAEDGWPARPKDTLNALCAQPADAPWLLSFVFEKPELVEQRWTWVRFAQRLFSAVPRTSAHDVEIALRAIKDLPALALALERMGVNDPVTIAEVARAARRLAEAVQDEDALWAVRAWQGALATLEQIHRHRAMPPQTMREVVSALARAMPPQAVLVTGNTASWFLHVLLPAVSARFERADDTEPEILRRVLTDPSSEGRQFNWEGVSYRIDLQGPVLSSVNAIRALATGPKLEHLASLDAAAGMLAKPLKTLDELARVVSLVESVLPVWQFEELADAVKELKKIRTVKDLPKAARRRPAVLAAIDGMTADIMPSLAYALAMSPSTQAARVLVDSPALHQFGTRETGTQWKPVAWLPGQLQARPAGGVAVRGSLLGVDLARALDQLSRAPGLSTRPAATGGAIQDITEAVLAERVVLRARMEWTEAGREIAAAIRRGRARFASWRRAPQGDTSLAADLDDLSTAGLSQSRQNQLRWLLERASRAKAEAAEHDLDGFLAVADYFRLGSPVELPAGWGQPARSIDGCWCVRGVDRWPIDRFRGYSTGYTAVAAADLPLRLAELLDEMRVPADLIEPMLVFAVRDLLDQTAQFVADDWQPLTWSNRLSTARVEDYLQALLARQILAPPGKSPEPAPAQR